MILWNIPNAEIAGAYRMGDCGAVISQYGLQGIYTASLFKYKKDAPQILPQCIELGRSFVVRKYQRDVLTLKLLLSGVMVSTLQMPHAEYFLGPVSMSNDYPRFYKSLALYFLKRDFEMPRAKRFAKAPNPLDPDFLKVDPEALLKVVPEGRVDKFDQLMGALSDGKYRLPVLVRKYFATGARVSCFNVDPDFADSLDSLIVTRLSDCPAQILNAFLRVVPQDLKQRVVKRFYGGSTTSAA